MWERKGWSLGHCCLCPIDDKHAQWQALEGQSAAAFNQGRVTKAIKHFKQALSTLAASGEDNPAAQERIVGKLSDALQCQLAKGGIDVTSMKNLNRGSEVRVTQSSCRCATYISRH